MKQNELLEDLFFVERGYLNGNHFVFRSDSPVLIDTGYISDFDETQHLIRLLGVRLEDISLIINTHTHCDHIGGNRIIQDQSNCDIALHSVGRYFINSRDDWSTWWRYYNQAADFFSCTRSLEDGDIINIGPHEFQVIYTPGHAADNIVLYNAREKILISSDALWENDMAVMTLRIEGSLALFQLQKSLEKLASLDVRMVFPGHGSPFTDLKGAISKSQAKIKKYLSNRELIGQDLIKKIIIYTLLMKKKIHEDEFFPYLMDTIWYRETIELYFNDAYELKYDEIMKTFIDRDIVQRNNGIFSTVIPS